MVLGVCTKSTVNQARSVRAVDDIWVRLKRFQVSNELMDYLELLISKIKASAEQGKYYYFSKNGWLTGGCP